MKSKIRQLIACAATFIMVSMSMEAQTSPVCSVPSPEAANLGTYGSVPVSLFTGIPDISVPIHEMRVGSMTFPVSLRYHLASVKPNQYPGIVGLGWSLQCGGCVTRTVRGVPDEKMTGKYENGFYGHCSQMAGITPTRLDSLTRNCTESEGSEWFEISADEFSFNFFGHSGNFYLNPEGGWTVVSDEDISVEFDPAKDFMDISGLAGRIPNVSGWPNRDKNKRHFIRFTLVTPDGCRFTFGGSDATDFSVPYYSRKSGDLIATSWHLSEIKTQDGRTVTYQYANGSDGNPYDLMVDIRYSPSVCRTTGFPSSGDNGVNIGRRGFTGFLLFPARLCRITTLNETLEFEYKADWRYIDAYSENHTGGALYWSGNGNSRISPWQMLDSSPHDQFGFLFPGFDYSTDPIANESIASLLVAHVLYGIRINRAGDDDTTVLFEYLEESRRKLGRVAWRTGLTNIETTYVEGVGVKYPFYSIPAETTDLGMPEYRFAYDPNHMPNGYILPQADRWGYWNGQTHKLADSNLEAPASVNATKSETLVEVIYPTGGRTVLEYERHDYSRLENDSHVLMDKYGVSGGLRVRRITNLSREDSIVSTKVFHYREGISTSARSSGVAKAPDPVAVTYNAGNNYVWTPLKGISGPYPVSMSIFSMYSFGLPVTNLNSPDVGYSCVIEETLDADGTSLGYVVNRFSNYGTDIHGNAHDDISAYHSYNISGIGGGLPYTSNSAERGHLLSRSWHRADGTEVRSESYRYTRVNDHPMPTATQRTIYLDRSKENFTSAKVAWLTLTNTYSYLPESTVVREGEYSDSTWTHYNSARQIISKSEMSSDGTQRTSRYTYPSDHSGQYRWMIDRHIMSPVVTEEVSSGTLRRTARNTYSSNESHNGPICYLSKIETLFGTEGTGKTDYEALSVDEWGNPTEIVENGVHSVLQWCGNGQRLMTRIEGITLEEYEALPELSDEARQQSDDFIVHPFIPDPVKRSVGGKLVWDYAYDTSLRLIQVMMPDELIFRYGYDALGRLSEESIFETDNDGNVGKKILRKYSYHYHND